MDMSATGMQLECEKKPPVVVGQVYNTRIAFDDGSMAVQVQVRWCKRRGLRRYLLGLYFVGLKPGEKHVLDAVAKFGVAGAAQNKMAGASAHRGKDHKRASSQDAEVQVDLPDYFKVLGLRPGADSAAIKASYRKLAVMYHPDRNKAPHAMEQFERLHEAYQVLSDTKRRENYLAMCG